MRRPEQLIFYCDEKQEVLPVTINKTWAGVDDDKNDDARSTDETADASPAKPHATAETQTKTNNTDHDTHTNHDQTPPASSDPEKDDDVYVVGELDADGDTIMGG